MPGPSVVIRAARASELALISALEKSGDELFRTAGMDVIADAPAPEPDSYRAALEGGRLLVAADEQDAALGFIRLEMLDGDPHVVAVSRSGMCLSPLSGTRPNWTRR